MDKAYKVKDGILNMTFHDLKAILASGDNSRLFKVIEEPTAEEVDDNTKREAEEKKAAEEKAAADKKAAEEKAAADKKAAEELAAKNTGDK